MLKFAKNIFTASPEEKNTAIPESKQVDGEKKPSMYGKFYPDDFYSEMEVEMVGGAKANAKKSKGRIEKKRSSNRKASIVFPRYKDGKKIGRSNRKK